MLLFAWLDLAEKVESFAPTPPVASAVCRSLNSELRETNGSNENVNHSRDYKDLSAVRVGKDFNGDDTKLVSRMLTKRFIRLSTHRY